MDREDARLAMSRHAAKLFVDCGVAGTSGDDIAAAAGVSTRTVWRYFRSKESCVEPLLARSALRFSAQLREWPRDMSIEAHLDACFALDRQTPQDIADGILIVRLIALLPNEPALRTAWLMACHQGEQDLIGIIADRLGRSPGDFEVKLCAATVAAAIRVIDETISMAAISHGQTFTTAEVVEQLAQAIRAASPLPFCDPVMPRIFGA
jgi:AcrR family transcriptional regulator